MRIALKIEGLSCPKCGSSENQRRNGHKGNLQLYKCKCCNSYYSKLIGKSKRYSEETKEQAIKAYYSGLSGRKVGQLFGMSKANVYRWIKKTEQSVDKSVD